MENDVTIYQDNKITQSRYEFTLIEKRIIYLIINEIRKKHILSDNSTDLFGDLIINLNYENFKEVSENTDLVYKSIRKLISKFYEFDDNEQWMVVNIINKAKHKKKDATWEFTIDSDMVSKFAELARNYTAYSLVVAMSLRSEHSQRMYEYCSQFRVAGGWRTSLKELRYKMKLEKKYDRYASFKLRVLEVAKKELKKMYDEGQSDLYFEYSEQKKGRTVHSLTFKIISNKMEVPATPEDIDYIVRTELFSIFETTKKEKNKEFISNILVHLRLDLDEMKRIHGKISWVKNTLPKDEWQKYLRFILKEDFIKK